MTPTEAVKLTRLVKAICPQQAIDDYTPDAWYELLSDLRLADCTEAIRQLGQQQVFIAPAEIRGAVRKLRTERIDKHGPLDPPPGMTTSETIEWTRRTRRAIADGEYIPPPALDRKPRNMAAIEGTVKTVEET